MMLDIIGYHRDCGGRIRKIQARRNHKTCILNRCGRCNDYVSCLKDILAECSIPQIRRQKQAGLRIKSTLNRID
jgi:hypothetical protein